MQPTPAAWPRVQPDGSLRSQGTGQHTHCTSDEAGWSQQQRGATSLPQLSAVQLHGLRPVRLPVTPATTTTSVPVQLREGCQQVLNQVLDSSNLLAHDLHTTKPAAAAATSQAVRQRTT